jgi:hypothetical protein
MSEPAESHPDPDTTPADGAVPPMPYPSAPWPRPSAQDAAPPMPADSANGHTHGSAASNRWRTAMMPLRKIMRRSPPGAA